MRPGLFIQSGLRGYEREESFKALSKFLPGSIVLTKKDFQGQSDLVALIKAITRLYTIDKDVNKPYFALDQEGGNVVRLDWLNYNPSNAFLGRINNLKLTEYVGSITGFELRNLGIDWNLAPVLDLFNPYNQVVLERSFSADPAIVAYHGTAYIDGLQKRGVAATAKHFPGHGGVIGDSHLLLPIDSRGYSSIVNDMYPFKLAIANNVRSVMLSHVDYSSLDSTYPASLSKRIYEVLRNDLNFNGVAITDSLNMKAVSSNFTVKEIASLASRGGADVLECVELDTATELSDYLDMRDEHESANRIQNLIPDNNQRFKPPDEILMASAILGSECLRCNETLDPDKPTSLIFLDETRETIVGEAQSSLHLVAKKLNSLSFNIKYYTSETLSEIPASTTQSIIIGRNEHLKNRIAIIESLSKKSKTIFIGTSVATDIGIIPSEIGYISTLSSKMDNIMGALYKAFGLL